MMTFIVLTSVFMAVALFAVLVMSIFLGKDDTPDWPA